VVAVAWVAMPDAAQAADTVAEAEPDGGSVAGRVLEEVAQEAAS
jgi:hypothetical protein